MISDNNFYFLFTKTGLEEKYVSEVQILLN